MTTVFAVVGGSGGVGASTFAGVLAAAAPSSVLIDLDPVGGGIDVVLGIESVPGARWSGLRVEGGYLDPTVLVDGLPRWGTCAVLAADAVPLDAAVVAQVIDSATASGVAAVVLALPRVACAVRAEALAGCDLVAVLTRCDVAGLVGAHAQVTSLGAATVGVIVRRAGVAPQRAAEIVGAPLLGVLPPIGMVDGAGRLRVPRAAHRVASGLLSGAGVRRARQAPAAVSAALR